TNEVSRVRDPLPWLTTLSGAGGGVNANYAPRLVLESIPGMTPAAADAMIKARSEAIFKNVADLEARTGFSSDSPVLKYLSFVRGSSPVFLRVPLLSSSSVVRPERRTWNPYRPPGWKIGPPFSRVLWLIERHPPADAS